MKRIEADAEITDNKSIFYEQKSEVYGISDEIGPAMKVILEIIKGGGFKSL